VDAETKEEDRRKTGWRV